MMGRVRWSHAVIALAVIAVVAMAAPAIGGPSLKKLVKKEVAKQIAKATGPPGPAGATGPQGAQGLKGDPGATNVVTRTASEAVADLAVGQQAAECLPGEVATGGGVGFITPNHDYVVMLTEPLEADGSLPEVGDVPTQWLGRARNESGVAGTMRVFVICASPWAARLGCRLRG